MLRVLSNPRRLCSGVTRRDLLQIGGLGMAGVGLPELLAAEGEGNATPGRGKAKNCILIYLYGAPSQLETFDMKPHAPVEIRGTMQPIPSVLPGLDVCEHLPNIARMTDRITVVRSITHPYPIHGVAFATTGIPAIDVAMELAPYDSRHHPYFGSVLQYLDQANPALKPGNVPQNVALPFPFSSQRVGEVSRAGPYAAFLGSTFNPTWTEFVGQSAGTVVKTLRDMKVDVPDPYVACRPESHFRFSAGNPQPELTCSLATDVKHHIVNYFCVK